MGWLWLGVAVAVVIVVVTAYALVIYARSLIELAASACDLDRATQDYGSEVKPP